jgi:hypothetical protein
LSIVTDRLNPVGQDGIINLANTIRRSRMPSAKPQTLYFGRSPFQWGIIAALVVVGLYAALKM